MIGDGIVTITLLLALAVLYYGPWQWLCTDIARQYLFKRRDAIFNMAADGKLSFKSQEYKEIRLSIERKIRFAHELTLPRFIILSLYVPENVENSIEKHINFIKDEAVRREMKGHIVDTQMAMVVMMLAKSPVSAIILTVAAVIVAFLERGRDGFRSWLAETPIVRLATSKIEIEAAFDLSGRRNGILQLVPVPRRAN